VLSAAATLLGVAILVFAILHLVPGDASDDAGEGGRPLTPEARAQFRAAYRLDEPLPRRFALWLLDLGRGDLGTSFRDGRPVATKIAERLPVSLVLNTLALVVMIVVAVPVGAVAAARPGSWVDRAVGAASYALYSVPVFWAALLLQMAFAVRLGWLPLYGIASEDAESLAAGRRILDAVAHLVLPVTCLAYGSIASVSRFVRATLLDSSPAAATRSARARGRSAWGSLWVHGMRCSAVPLLTLAGFLLPRLVGGSVVVEWVFGIPGLGSLFYESVLARDLPTVLGMTLLSGSAVLGGILAADLAYGIADPRVRRSP
jgi:peptide/nickel transport system permease protein